MAEKERPPAQIDPHNTILSEELFYRWKNLRSKLIQSPLKKGSIDQLEVPWLDDPEQVNKYAEYQAARMIAHIFQDTGPTYIVGIANAGTSISEAVAREFPKAHHLLAVKSPNPIFDFRGRSYITRSSGERSWGYDYYDVPFLPYDSKALIVDGIVREASSSKFISKMIYDQMGVSIVGFATYLDFAYEGGLQAIADLGIPSFSVLRVEEVRDGKAHLIPEKESLQILQKAI